MGLGEEEPPRRQTHCIERVQQREVVDSNRDENLTSVGQALATSKWVAGFSSHPMKSDLTMN